MRNLSKNLILAITVFLFIAFAFSLVFNFQAARKTENLSIDQLVKKINEGAVKSIAVNGSQLKIEMTDGAKAVSRKEAEAGFSETLKNYGVSGEALQKVEFKIQEESGLKYWLGILVPAILPVLIMILIFWWIFR